MSYQVPGGRPNEEDWGKVPCLPNGRIDKKRVKELYDASPHIEWVTFCESMNWSAQQTRHKVNITAWVTEKKFRIESKMAAQVCEMAVRHKSTWIKDVQETLENYPRAVDNVMALLGEHMRQISSGAIKIKTGDYLALAATVKTCIEAKKSILLLNDVVVKLKDNLPAEEEGSAIEWKMEFKGAAKLTPQKFTNLMLSYLDKPTEEKEILEAEFEDAET